MLDLEYIEELRLDAIPDALAGELIEAESVVQDGQDFVSWSSFI